eukprot:527515_1
MKVIPIYSRKRSSDNGDHHQIKRMKISSTPGWSSVTPAQPTSSSSTPRVPPPPHSIARPRIVPIHSRNTNKMLLEAIIEEANEIEEMTPPPPPPPKKKRAKKK